MVMQYLVSQGRSVLAKSVNPHRVEANMHILDLRQDELDELAACAENPHRYVYPQFGVDFGFPDKAASCMEK